MLPSSIVLMSDGASLVVSVAGKPCQFLTDRQLWKNLLLEWTSIVLWYLPSYPALPGMYLDDIFFKWSLPLLNNKLFGCSHFIYFRLRQSEVIEWFKYYIVQPVTWQSPPLGSSRCTAQNKCAHEFLSGFSWHEHDKISQRYWFHQVGKGSHEHQYLPPNGSF